MNKYFLGLVIFPVFPIILYFVDMFFFDGFLAGFIRLSLLWFGLSCVEGRLNFYCFSYQRTVFFNAVLMSPIFFAYWLSVINLERFKLLSFRKSLKLNSQVVLVLLIFLALAFLPLELGGNPSRKKIAIANFHRNSLGFTLIVYWFLFFNFMLLSVSIKHVVFFLRRNIYANTI